jgi:diguanylate cyclase (GGDEF)-like protein
MRRRIGIFGASEEALELIPLLAANPSIEVIHVYDPEAEALLERLAHFEPGVAALLEHTLTDDPATLGPEANLDAVIDAGDEGAFEARVGPADEALQVLTPLTARLLWCHGTTPEDHKAELLQALHEIVASYNLTVDTDELFTRMLEIALGVTGAEGGSVMLLDPERGELAVRVAVGIEKELWPKICVRLGEGIAGRVAQEGRSLRLRGKADRKRFQVVRERIDIESAICVPLVREGRVLGVLNLHHGSRADAFSEKDLEFAEDLARLDAQIIARAQEQDDLRSKAARYAATREVQRILDTAASLPDRLQTLCRFVAEKAGYGIANLYLHDPDEDALRLAATSLSGSEWVGEVRVRVGEGLDGRAAETGEPTVLYDKHGALAYAALPLVATQVLVGVLSVQVGDSGQTMLPEPILNEIAQESAHEIAQAEREARAQARVTRTGAIQEAGLRILSSPNAEQVLSLSASSAAMVLESEHAVLRLQDPETKRFVIRSYFGTADEPQKERLFRLDKHMALGALNRRGPVWIRHAESDPSLSDFDTRIRSLVVTPLACEGRMVGTLALYEKISPNSFLPGRFAKEDLALLGSFANYVERALESTHAVASRQSPYFDDDTRLPNALYLEQRLEQEIARARARDDSLTVVVARIQNLAELDAEAVTMLLVESLRSRSRGFDVVGRLSADEFAVILPEPGAAPSERVTELARAVADDIHKDDVINQPTNVSLSFGYASVPNDGTDSAPLLERARVARIEMV